MSSASWREKNYTGSLPIRRFLMSEWLFNNFSSYQKLTLLIHLRIPFSTCLIFLFQHIAKSSFSSFANVSSCINTRDLSYSAVGTDVSYERPHTFPPIGALVAILFATAPLTKCLCAVYKSRAQHIVSIMSNTMIKQFRKSSNVRAPIISSIGGTPNPPTIHPSIFSIL